MPTIIVSKKNLLNKIGDIKEDLLKEKISMIGTSLEDLNGDEVTVEIFPNRPDYLSEEIFAKSLFAFITGKKGYSEYSSKKLPDNFKIIVDNSVKEVRPFTVCAVVKNLKFDDNKIREIIQMQEKLHVTFCRNRKKAAIGIYPMEKITFPVHFKASAPEKIKFTPLEWKSELDGKEILELHPTGKDYAHLLDGLKKYPYFIDSKNNILSMPPIINSENTGRVTTDTNSVFIECSGFDLDTLSKLLNIIVCSLSEMGGEIYSLPVEYGDSYDVSELEILNNIPKKNILITPNLSSQKMKIDSEYISKKLGLSLKEKDIKSCLSRMCIDYEDGVAIIPPYRADILHPVDLVEDIAIGYDFFKFTPVIPKVATIGEEDKLEIFKKKLRDILIGFGLIEVKNYNIVSLLGQTTKLLYGEEYSKDVIVLQNSLTIEFDSMRKNLLSSAIMTLENNKNNDYPQNFFEIGECFSSDIVHKNSAKELLNKGIIKNNYRFDSKCFDFPKTSVTLSSKEVDFTKIKQVLDGIFDSIGIKYALSNEDSIEFAPFIKGRVASISVDDILIGTLGEINPEIIFNSGLEFPIVHLELNLFNLYLSYLKNK